MPRGRRDAGLRVGGHSTSWLPIAGKETQYPLWRRLAGPRGLTGKRGNISSPPRFGPWTIQSVVSIFTVCISPANNWEDFQKNHFTEGCGRDLLQERLKRNLGMWNRPWITVVLDEVKIEQQDGR